jgi:hypothetical protein
MGRSGLVAVVLAAVAFAATGCAAFEPNELEQAASEAKSYPFVLDAYFVSGGMWDEDLLEVIVADSTTGEQAATLWCEVIAPHGGDVSTAIIETESHSLPSSSCPAD